MDEAGYFGSDSEADMYRAHDIIPTEMLWRASPFSDLGGLKAGECKHDWYKSTNPLRTVNLVVSLTFHVLFSF